jgi:hypothetical protein
VRSGCGLSARLHTSACVSIRSAYVSIRQHTSAYAKWLRSIRSPAYVSIRQHTSAYVSIRQHTSADASICEVAPVYPLAFAVAMSQHTSAYVSIRQRMSTFAVVVVPAVPHESA